MTGLRYATTLMAVVALLLIITPIQAFGHRVPTKSGPTRSNSVSRLTRCQCRQVGSKVQGRPPFHESPTQPPADQFRARPKPRQETEQNSSAGREQSKKVATATWAPRVSSAKRSRSRVVVAPRSFLDAGTEVLPGELRRSLVRFCVGALAYIAPHASETPSRKRRSNNPSLKWLGSRSRRSKSPADSLFALSRQGAGDEERGRLFEGSACGSH